MASLRDVWKVVQGLSEETSVRSEVVPWVIDRWQFKEILFKAATDLDV